MIYNAQQKLLALENNKLFQKTLESGDTNKIKKFLRTWVVGMVEETVTSTVSARLEKVTGSKTVARLLLNKNSPSKKLKGKTFLQRLNSLLDLVDTDIQNLELINPDNIKKLLFSNDFRTGFSAFYKHVALFLVSEPNRTYNQSVRMLTNLYSDTLVHWVTVGDEKVCDICIGLENEGPYKMSKYPEYPHPLCRCDIRVSSLVKEYSEEGISLLGDLYEAQDRILSGDPNWEDGLNIDSSRFTPILRGDSYLETEIRKIYRFISENT